MAYEKLLVASQNIKDELQDWLDRNKINYDFTLVNGPVTVSHYSITFSHPNNNRFFRIENVKMLDEIPLERLKNDILKNLGLNDIEAVDTVTVKYNGVSVTMYRDDFIEFLQSHKIN